MRPFLTLTLIFTDTIPPSMEEIIKIINEIRAVRSILNEFAATEAKITITFKGRQNKKPIEIPFLCIFLPA